MFIPKDALHQPETRTTRLYEALLEISNFVGSVLPVRELLGVICRIAAEALETDTCSLYLRESVVDRDNRESRRLVLRATHGLRPELIDKGSFNFGDGIPGWAAASNKTVTVRDARQDPRYAPLDDGPDENFVAYLCVPLRVQEEVIGVLSMRRREPCDWTDEDEVFAEILAKQVSIVIEKARLYHDKLEAERLGAIAISLSETAHSIKNMLTGMSGGAFIIEAALETGELDTIRRGWNMLKRNQAKIQRLVKNMLSFSRSAELAFEPTDLNALIALYCDETRDAAELRGVRLETKLDPAVPQLSLDPTAFGDALLNLITNAIDAIPEGRENGTVQVSTSFDAGRGLVTIEIQDNGSGIPDDAREKMFRLFFTTKGNAGTGIGLAVTKKLIEEHGGTIDFTTKVNVGTIFRVQLPTKK